MNRYYRPIREELVKGLPIEMFYEGTWHKTMVDDPDQIINLEDIRVKYLDEDDFLSLGMKTQAPFLRVEKVFTGVVIINKEGNEEEEYEEVNIYDYNRLNVLSKNDKVIGKFYPNEYENNTLLNGQKFHFKNLFELENYVKQNHSS